MARTGQRLAQIAARLRIDHRVLDSGETAPPDPLAVDAELARDRDITHAVMVHGETTTGMLNPIDALRA